MTRLRLSRVEQSRANREAILASALEQFELHGYHGASVDAIAEDAGFSKGVIYSQFGSKEDLMLAVLEQEIAERHRATERLIATLGEHLDAAQVIGEAFSRSLGKPAWQAALTEFRIHAARQPELNDRYRELHEQTIDKVSSVMARLVDQLGIETRFSMRQLAISYLAAGLGLAVETLAVEHLDPIGYLRSLATLTQPVHNSTEGADQ